MQFRNRFGGNEHGDNSVVGGDSGFPLIEIPEDDATTQFSQTLL